MEHTLMPVIKALGSDSTAASIVEHLKQRRQEGLKFSSAWQEAIEVFQPPPRWSESLMGEEPLIAFFRRWCRMYY